MSAEVIIGVLVLVAGILAIVKLFNLGAGGGSGATNNDEMVEIKAHLAQIASQSTEIHKTVASTISDSEARLGKNLEQSMRDQNERTNKSLTGMAERLVVITEANTHISKLSGQVSELQSILSNKQARGSFGEVQLENLVRDALPDSAFKFQHTLGNGRRVDCLLDMPAPPGPICIDSKFPLEAYRAMKAAESDENHERARREFESAVKKHINDIAERYIVPGETADSAILFLPSESVYAEVHLQLPKVIDEGRRRRVYVAGPDNLMLILHTVRAILRDARMHEAAGLIQREVDTMMKDVGRLGDRVDKLATHFDQAQRDISDIQTSSRKIVQRGEKITDIEVEEDDTPAKIGSH